MELSNWIIRLPTKRLCMTLNCSRVASNCCSLPNSSNQAQQISPDVPGAPQARLNCCRVHSDRHQTNAHTSAGGKVAEESNTRLPSIPAQFTRRQSKASRPHRNHPAHRVPDPGQQAQHGGDLFTTSRPFGGGDQMIGIVLTRTGALMSLCSFLSDCFEPVTQWAIVQTPLITHMQ